MDAVYSMQMCLGGIMCGKQFPETKGKQRQNGLLSILR